MYICIFRLKINNITAGCHISNNIGKSNSYTFPVKLACTCELYKYKDILLANTTLNIYYCVESLCNAVISNYAFLIHLLIRKKVCCRSFDTCVILFLVQKWFRLKKKLHHICNTLTWSLSTILYKSCHYCYLKHTFVPIF